MVDFEFAKNWVEKNPGGLKSVIYRGVENEGNPFIFIDPSKYKRVSAYHDYNYYTLLFDNLPSWKSYPKRSQSIVCATDKNIARNYGYVYRVFPKIRSKIGVCSDSDIWSSFKAFNTMSDFNNMLHNIFEILKGTVKEPHTYEDLEKNFAIVDRFKVDIFDDVRLIHKEDNPDDEPLSDELAENAVYTMLGILFDFNSQQMDDGHYFMSDFIRDYKDDFHHFINDVLDPDDNRFKLEVIGKPLPPMREVWTSGQSLMVLDSEVDRLLK